MPRAAVAPAAFATTKIFCGWGACVLYVACSFCELRNLIEKSSWV